MKLRYYQDHVLIDTLEKFKKEVSEEEFSQWLLLHLEAGAYYSH